MRAGSSRWVLAAPVLYMAVIFEASSLPAAQIPRAVASVSDKALHSLEYAVLGSLWYWALSRTTEWKTPRVVGAAILIGMLWGASDEFHQSFVPGRAVEFLDFVADTVGSVVGAVLAWSAHRWADGRRGSSF